MTPSVETPNFKESAGRSLTTTGRVGGGRVAALLCLPILLPVLWMPNASWAQQYHTYPQIESTLAQFEADHSAICRRLNLGLTVQGRTMWALLITDHPDMEEDEPEVRYVSSLHGDEIVGVEMCLRLIDELTNQYGIDPRITALVNEAEIWIVPCANPDGFVAGTRTNARGVDLNRNFPCPYTSPENTTVGREPETAHLMTWAQSNSFTLAANLHSGALVVNYPFDSNSTGSATYTASPDDDLFIWISEEYSRHNPPMWNSLTFTHGITNGADWYVIYGGLQDWTYRFTGGNEVTIELANSTPPASQLETYWSNNRESMLSYIETAFVGIRGIVTDADTGQPLDAVVSVVGRHHDVRTDPDVGDYHRMLLPGVYDLTFDSVGRDRRQAGSVVVYTGSATRYDVSLFALPELISPIAGDVLHVGSPTTIAWAARADVRYGVDVTLNAGALTIETDGFEGGTLGNQYESGGNAIWTVQASSPHSGIRAARAGAILNNQLSWLTRTVEGPATVAFWYRVSSELNYDFFEFEADGQVLVRRSGEVAYTRFVCELGSGPHVLKWTYSKDVSIASGSDTAWIDDLELTTDAMQWNEIIAATQPGVESFLWYPPMESDAAKIRIRAIYSDGYAGNWVESGGTFTIAPSAYLGDLNCDAVVSIEDVMPFALSLVSSEEYEDAYPGCDPMHADLNADFVLDSRDIEPFVSMLVGS